MMTSVLQQAPSQTNLYLVTLELKHLRIVRSRSSWEYVKSEQITDSWDERRIVHHAPELGSSPNSYLNRQNAVLSSRSRYRSNVLRVATDIIKAVAPQLVSYSKSPFVKIEGLH